MKAKDNAKTLKHPFEPLYNKNSRILILGSFPSVKSREQSFFYGHPQNRFWRVMSLVCNCEVPQTIQQKKEFLYQNRIALWDSIKSCTICGSSDSSIKDVTANDISRILNCADIKKIFVNGKASEKYYKQLIYPQTKIEAEYLPSTSPANAAWSIERLADCWKNKISGFLR